MTHVYLDHNATTPLDPRVLERMLPFLRDEFGNASSRHERGTVARKAIDTAREQVAALVEAQPAQIVFTSGGTEANNLFVKGAAAQFRASQIVVSAIEHPCVAKPAESLARQGWKVRRLAVTGSGCVDLADLDVALREPTALVSVMLANNETGVLQDVEAVAERARAAKAWSHTDAVQALGKIPLSFADLGVNAMTISAHKIYGPKGAGALVVDKRIELLPLLSGGGHERGMRSGTENVAAIVGFGAACELAQQELRTRATSAAQLRERLERGLHAQRAVIFGESAARLPNTTYFALRGIEGETLVVELDKAGYAVAAGAACSSANPEPSATLLAMGIAPDIARGAVRVSIGNGNTVNDIDGFLAALAKTATRLKGMTALTA